jgi:hypothetical protein
MFDLSRFRESCRGAQQPTNAATAAHRIVQDAIEDPNSIAATLGQSQTLRNTTAQFMESQTR